MANGGAPGYQFLQDVPRRGQDVDMNRDMYTSISTAFRHTVHWQRAAKRMYTMSGLTRWVLCTVVDLKDYDRMRDDDDTSETLKRPYYGNIAFTLLPLTIQYPGSCSAVHYNALLTATKKNECTHMKGVCAFACLKFNSRPSGGSDKFFANIFFYSDRSATVKRLLLAF